MIDLLKVLVRPLVTEKSTNLKEDWRQYSFEVQPDASKGDIAKAVEALFNVRVVKVRTVNVPGKLRRMGRNQGYRPDWKKALVTIAQDQKIDFEKAL